jgi:hypothetical protein
MCFAGKKKAVGSWQLVVGCWLEVAASEQEPGGERGNYRGWNIVRVRLVIREANLSWFLDEQQGLYQSGRRKGEKNIK